MSEPFLAQVTMFAGTFNPRGWAFCSGQLLSIAQNSALFSLLGTTYGGDGRNTFGLPDLRGRYPRGSEGNSAGPGLTAVPLGQKAGSENRILTVGNLPSHNHPMANNAVEESGNQTDPANHNFAETDDMNYSDATAGARAGAATTGNQGGNQQFSILDPFLGLNYIIATVGIFPSRN